MVNPALPLALVGLASQLLTSDRDHKGIGGTRYATGGLLCPGIDVDEFAAACRAPIFRDAWNQWRLFYTSAHDTLPHQVASTVQGYFGKINADLGGRIRHLTIEVDKASWQSPPIVTRMMCDQPMSLRASTNAPAYWTVYARFVYRGTETHIPWVSLQSYPTPHTCPHSADLLLDAVCAPDQGGVPDAATDSPLPPHVDPKNEGWDALTPDLDLGTKIVLGGGALLAVAVLAGYAIRSVR